MVYDRKQHRLGHPVQQVLEGVKRRTVADDQHCAAVKLPPNFTKPSGDPFDDLLVAFTVGEWIHEMTQPESIVSLLPTGPILGPLRAVWETRSGRLNPDTVLVAYTYGKWSSRKSMVAFALASVVCVLGVAWIAPTDTSNRVPGPSANP